MSEYTCSGFAAILKLATTPDDLLEVKAIVHTHTHTQSYERTSSYESQFVVLVMNLANGFTH